MWDLYNEPRNNKLDEDSLGLVEAVFKWAREAEPSQPLSVGVWYRNDALNKYQLEHSDIITFHSYQSVEELESIIVELKQHDRNMICTEYMARTRGSTFQKYLPILRREEVGAINWGLVNGKNQTIYSWGSPEGGPEPATWFHNIFREDGRSYRAEETDFIRKMLR